MATTVETTYTAKGNHVKFLEDAIAKQNKMLESIKKASDGVNKFNRGLLSTALVVGTVKKAYSELADFIGESIELTNQQITADTRLITISKRVTGATESQIDATMRLADAMQEVTTVGDEATEMGQSQLASFGLVSKSVDTLTESLLNLGVAQFGADVNGQELIQTANMIGKAYSGLPGALSRVGVLLNDQQAEMLKTGDQAERVATLVEIVEQNYGGLAKALRDTPEGRVRALENEFSDLREEIGMAFLPVTFEAKRAQIELADAVFNTTGDLQSYADMAVKAVRAVAILGQGALTAAEGINSSAASVLRFLNNASMFNPAIVAARALFKEYNKNFSDVDKVLREFEKESDIALEKRMKKLLESADKFNSEIERGVKRTTDTGDFELPDLTLDTDDDAPKEQQKAYEELIRQREAAYKEIRLFAVAEDQREIARVNNHFREMLQLFEDAGDAATEIRGLILEEWQTQLDKLDRSTPLRQFEDFWQSYGSIAEQGVSDVASIMSNIYSRQSSDIEENTKRQIEAVEKSTKSQKLKAKEIEKIEKESQRKQQEIRMKQWRADLVTSIANTALSVSRALSNPPGVPYTIPFGIAAGVAGGVQTGIIASNKPRFQTGSVDASGLPRRVGQAFGTSGGIDSQVGLFTPGELIVPPGPEADAAETFLRNRRSGGGGGNVFAPQITISVPVAGDATDDTVLKIQDAVERAVVNIMENDQYMNLVNVNLAG